MRVHSFSISITQLTDHYHIIQLSHLHNLKTGLCERPFFEDIIFAFCFIVLKLWLCSGNYTVDVSQILR